MPELLFADKCVTYDTFVNDLARVVTKMVVDQLRNGKDVLTQNEAYRRFGRANVDRWVRQCRLEPLAVRPGKKEYRLDDLMKLHNCQQDYLY